jgi:hypothetical protein
MMLDKISLSKFNNIDSLILLMPTAIIFIIQSFRAYREEIPNKLDEKEQRRSNIYEIILGIFLLFFIAIIIYAAIRLLPLYLH